MNMLFWVFVSIFLYGVYSKAEIPEDSAIQMADLVSPKISDDEWRSIVADKIKESYEVQSGDTLWDISKMMFGNSFVWPKLWTLNTNTIGNPHVLEPGYVLMFDPGTASPVMVSQFDSGEVGNQGPEYAQVPMDKFQNPLPTPPESSGQVSVVGQLGFSGTNAAHMLHYTVIKEPYTQKAMITSSSTSKIMLSQGDEVRGTYKYPPARGVLSVARLERQIAGSDSSSIYKIIGSATLQRSDNGTFSAVINNIREPIQREDILIPDTSVNASAVSIVTNTGPLKGRIVDVLESGRDQLREGAMVVVNLGGAKGMRIGTPMDIYTTDPINPNANFSYRRGSLKIVRVSEDYSIGVVHKIAQLTTREGLVVVSSGVNPNELPLPVVEDPTQKPDVQEALGIDLPKDAEEEVTSEEDALISTPEVSKPEETLPEFTDEINNLDEDEFKELDLKNEEKNQEELNQLTDPGLGTPGGEAIPPPPAVAPEESAPPASSEPSTPAPPAIESTPFDQMDPDSFDTLTEEEEKLLN